MLGIIGGTFIPLQTSINARLNVYTKSPIYTSTISFGVGLLFLLLLNILFHPELLTISFLREQSFHYYWFSGGLLGVVFLTGNLLLLPRLGASLTVVISLTGQLMMGVLIDAFGWFDATIQPFTFLKASGLFLLFIGIILMNYVKSDRKVNLSVYLWLVLGLVVGFGPPIQTAINSKLSQVIDSTFMASFVSFLVGFIVLLMIKIITNKNFKLEANHSKHGSLKPLYFIGGILGVVFITANIFLMPYLGAALTTISAMFGQMIIALIIDHFGLLGIHKRKITSRKIIGITIIILGILFLRTF